MCIFIIVDSKHESSSSEVEHVMFCLSLAYHSMPFPSELGYYGLTIKKLIDKQLQERGRYPYNTYKFVEKVVSSDVPNPLIPEEFAGGNARVLDDKMKEQEEIEKLKNYSRFTRE